MLSDPSNKVHTLIRTSSSFSNSHRHNSSTMVELQLFSIHKDTSQISRDSNIMIRVRLLNMEDPSSDILPAMPFLQLLQWHLRCSQPMIFRRPRPSSTNCLLTLARYRSLSKILMTIQRQCQSSIISQLYYDTEAEQLPRNRRIGCWTARARRSLQLRGTSWHPERRRLRKSFVIRVLCTEVIVLLSSTAIRKSLISPLPCWDASLLELLLFLSMTYRITNG